MSRVGLNIFLNLNKLNSNFGPSQAKILFNSNSIYYSTNYPFRTEYYFRHKINKYKFISNTKYLQVSLTYLHR